MTQYKLKTGIENFDVVDGPFAGRKFVRGKEYGEVPSEEKRKFEEIRNQKTEDRRQKTEDGDQKSEVLGLKSKRRNP